MARKNLMTLELTSRSELRVLLLICEDHKYVEETTSLGFVHGAAVIRPKSVGVSYFIWLIT